MSGNDTGGGMVCPQGMILPFTDESKWNPAVRGTLYFVALIYAFIGVSVVTDIFMAAVVTITSLTRKVYLPKSQLKRFEVNNSESSAAGEEPLDYIEVRVWNETVANLTLMALGTSAPEILLACIEIIGHNFESGELGPGTIVGSAAFNLLIITATCMLSIPKGEVRRIRLFNVFLVSSAFSVFAYLWLWIVLSLITPHVVDMWEAFITFLMFPVLVLVAYISDKGCCGLCSYLKRLRREMERVHPDDSDKSLVERQFFKDGVIDKEDLVAFVREIKKYPGITYEDAAVLAASKIIDFRYRSVGHYRMGAVRKLIAGRRLHPKLSAKLKEVYEAINAHPSAPFLGLIPEVSPSTHAVVEFHAAICAVKENIGSFSVTVCRHGNLRPSFKVRVESIDGSAKAKDDYVRINEILYFMSGETEKQVLVQIVSGKEWEPDEEFFLKLTLMKTPDNELVQLGTISIMEVTIIDEGKPGVVGFDRRGYLVKESAGAVILKVRRKYGADGEVRVKWRTIDKTAISGRDFVGGEGELLFKHREIVKTLEIPIIDNLKARKEEAFEVELFSPGPNTSLGNIIKTTVTITNDDAFAYIIEKMMNMTAANLESLAFCRKTWKAQIKDAMNVNGGDIQNAKSSDYFLHFISFVWKVLFSFIPPPSILGGWLCFFVSLLGIGLVTALIGDIARVFGCIVGLRDAITAITLVAMGTSLPDTFASRSAAIKEQYADTSIGNVNGSNSVNVFLGLGLPWLLATIYHKFKGTIFKVPAGTLGFSVLLFSICAFIAITMLMVRRHLKITGRAELGGPALHKWISAVVLLTLWCSYIAISSLQEYGFIKINV